MVREGLVASAVKFLLSCKPSATAESKMAFLTGKGLSIQECFTAFERAKQRAPDFVNRNEGPPTQTGIDQLIPEGFDVPSVSFTLEQLRQYDGTQRAEIYIALSGIIFDVSTAPQFYGPEANYNVYAGREAGRALGKMNLHSNPTQHQHDLDFPWVCDLDAEARQVLSDWFRKFSGKYPCVGRVHTADTPPANNDNNNDNDNDNDNNKAESAGNVTLASLVGATSHVKGDGMVTTTSREAVLLTTEKKNSSTTATCPFSRNAAVTNSPTSLEPLPSSSSSSLASSSSTSSPSSPLSAEDSLPLKELALSDSSSAVRIVCATTTTTAEEAGGNTRTEQNKHEEEEEEEEEGDEEESEETEEKSPSQTRQ